MVLLTRACRGLSITCGVLLSVCGAEAVLATSAQPGGDKPQPVAKPSSVETSLDSSERVELELVSDQLKRSAQQMQLPGASEPSGAQFRSFRGQETFISAR